MGKKFLITTSPELSVIKPNPLGPKPAHNNPLTKFVSLNFPEDAAVVSSKALMHIPFLANADQLIKRRGKCETFAKH